MKCFVVSMFVVAVLAVSVPVNANTVFSENFESHATGIAIQNATGWENSAADGPVLINGYDENSVNGHKFPNGGNALDGNSGNEVGSGKGRVWATSRTNVPAPSATALTYTLQFDAIVAYGSHNNGSANAGVYLGCDDCGEFGLHYSRHNGNGWRFVGPSGTFNATALDGDGNPAAAQPWWMANTPVTASIALDKASMTATATIHDPLGSYNDLTYPSQDINQNIWNGIAKIEVRNDTYDYGNNLGIDVDNISISETNIPEPTTLGLALLGLCGLAGIRRKR